MAHLVAEAIVEDIIKQVCFWEYMDKLTEVNEELKNRTYYYIGVDNLNDIRLGDYGTITVFDFKQRVVHRYRLPKIGPPFRRFRYAAMQI